MMMKGLKKRRAVTLTELLVVMAIIALLATIAVPVYLNQMQRARLATAQAETREIAEAMQAVAITHGFLVPIHLLDNVPNSDSTITGSSSSQDDFDNLSNRSSHYLIDVARPLDSQLGNNQLNLSQTTDPRIAKMIKYWQGPFLNPTRVRYENENPNSPGSGDLTIDLVVDPWGNPYRVWAPNGIASSAGFPANGSTQDVLLTMDDLRLPTGQGDGANRFDRFAIVSLGPDGLVLNSTNPLIIGDDIFYQFSVLPSNETQYTIY